MSRIQLLTLLSVVLVILFVGVGLLNCYLQNKAFNLDLSEFIGIVLATGAIVSSLSLVQRAFTNKHLERILEFDITSLYIGAAATIDLLHNSIMPKGWKPWATTDT